MNTVHSDWAVATGMLKMDLPSGICSKDLVPVCYTLEYDKGFAGAE